MSGKDSSKVKVAIVQTGSELFDTAKTLDCMAAHCKTVAAENPDLVLFPEAYIGGYPAGLSFGSILGARTLEGRNDFVRYYKAAIDVPGPETDRIGTFASELSAFILVGVIERCDSTLYCTILFFGPDGSILGKRRKLKPTGSERLIWAGGDGSTIPVFDTKIGRIGAAICWENYMPDLRQSLYAKGVNIYCAPNVEDRDVWQSTMRHIAFEGRTFVLSACQYFTRARAPEDYNCELGNDPETVLIRGGSMIVDPFGEIIAGPVFDKDAILTAELDMDEIIRGKFDLDIAGHYARPDIFNLTVNDSPQPLVNFARDQIIKVRSEDESLSQI